MKSKVWSAAGLMVFAVVAKAATEEHVYFCVVDQIVGLQSSQQDSGNIRIGEKGRFKLTYKPSRLATDESDPLYMSPSLTGDITGRGKPKEFVLYDPLSAFSFESSGPNRMSLSGVAVGEANIEKAKVELLKQIDADKKSPSIGTYVYYTGLFGNEHLFMAYRTGKILQGIYSTTSFVDRKKDEKTPPARAIYGYMHYFTCEDF